MPTAVRLTGVTCLYDEEQDPPGFSCTWSGFEVPTNDNFVLTVTSIEADPVGDDLNNAMITADYEFE